MRSWSGTEEIVRAFPAIKKVLRLLGCVLFRLVTAVTELSGEDKSTGSCKRECNTREMECIGAIDQGTQSSRVFLYDRSANLVASHQVEFTQITPKPGCVGHALFIIN